MIEHTCWFWNLFILKIHWAHFDKFLKIEDFLSLFFQKAYDFRTSNTFIKIDFHYICSPDYVHIYLYTKILIFSSGTFFSFVIALLSFSCVYKYIYLPAHSYITCCASMLIRIELSNWRSSTTFSNQWTLILHNNIIMMKNYQRINNVSPHRRFVFLW